MFYRKLDNTVRGVVVDKLSSEQPVNYKAYVTTTPETQLFAVKPWLYVTVGSIRSNYYCHLLPNREEDVEAYIHSYFSDPYNTKLKY
ncbi:hypothetical protein evm_002544 [Chilo suppressalis]|nr:hypothetical protein evm_002544 [Chilo suppressalis]